MPSKTKTKTNKPRRKSKSATKSATKSAATPIQNSGIPPDADELELEKLVFGDSDGFRQGLLAIDALPEEEDYDKQKAVTATGEVDNADDAEIAALRDDELFFIDDTMPGGILAAPSSADPDTEMALAPAGPQPAWYDSDDERITISLASHSRMRKLRTTAVDDFVSGSDYAGRLRTQFERIYPAPEWALPDKPSKRARHEGSDSEANAGSGMEGEGEEALSAPPLAALLQSTDLLTASASASKPNAVRLRPEVLDIARLPDATVSAPSRSGIQSLSFHPSHPLLLTSGFDSTLRLYHIDTRHNPLATSLHIRSTPLTSAIFHPSGTRIIAGGRRRYFHAWDLSSGTVARVTNIYGHSAVQKSMERLSCSPDGAHVALIGSKGTVQILDATTLQWVASARVEGEVADTAWTPDGAKLLVVNRGGEVYEYSLSTHFITAVWRDEGAVSTTSLAVSSRFTAVGSASGVVNIYDRQVSWGTNGGVDGRGTPEDPKPIKTVESLVTAVHVLEFSVDGQVLAMASRAKNDALRLVHLPSATVYKNWPTSKTPLGRVSAIAWASGSGMLCVGNEKGDVRVFELKG